MATTALNDCKVYIAGFDLSGSMNAVALEYGADMLDATTFGQTTRINKGGLKSVVAKCEGLWDADGTSAPEDVIWSRIGTQDVPITISPSTGAVGQVAYLFRSIHSEYSTGAAIGELLPYSVSAEGSDGNAPGKGFILHAAGSTTADANGASVTFPAVGSGQKLVGSIHVLSASASDTLDVTVESDSASNYPSATTRLTFAQLTAAGDSDFQVLAGPITDTEYRVVINVGGTSPDFSFIVAIGIAY